MPLEVTLGLVAGKALISVRGDFGGTFGGSSFVPALRFLPELGLEIHWELSCGSLLTASSGGTGGVLGGIEGTTRGARLSGKSIEDALRCDLSSHCGVFSAGSISCLVSDS